MTNPQASVGDEKRSARLVATALSGRGADMLLLAGCVALAATLACHRIGAQSFWLDEAFSVAVAQRSLPEVWATIVSQQANMALYYLLLHWWLPLGYDEATIRSLSALCMVLAVVPLWGIARRLGGRWTASLAAVFFTTNGFLIARAAQEARGYGLTVLATTSASYLFLRALERNSRRAWAAYSLSGALAMYTHYFAAWVLLTHFIAGMVHPERRRGVLLSQLAMVPLVTPLIIPVFTTHHITWVAPLTPRRLVAGVIDLAGRGGPLLLIAYLLACGWALGGRGRRGASLSEALSTWARWFLASWLATPIVLTVLFSLRKPIFVPWYLLICIPPAAILAASGIMAVRRTWLRAAAAAVLIGLALNGLRQWYEGRFPKEDWRGASGWILKEAQPGDGIIFEAPYVRVAFEYYLQKVSAARAMLTPVFPSTPWVGEWGGPTRDRFDDGPVSDEDARRRLWVVVSHEPVTGAGTEWRPAALERMSCRTAERRFHLVRVIRYEPGVCTPKRRG